MNRQIFDDWLSIIKRANLNPFMSTTRPILLLKIVVIDF